MKKRAVIYGGGNVGRGFIAQLFYESGCETAFIDINKELIGMINEKMEYPIEFAGSQSPHEIIIQNIRGVDGSPENSDEISDVISKSDIMATAVGVNTLKFIMKPIADGINKRFADNNPKHLNIILCENLIGADKFMREGIFEYIRGEFKDLYNEKIGLVSASVDRMVPVQTEKMKSGNPLRIVTENFEYLYIDGDACKGEMPEIKNMIAYSPFKYLIERKLYIHNMGHAVCAYLGDIGGYEYIWQSAENPYIKEITVNAMRRSAMAMYKTYNSESGGNYPDLAEYISDLIQRFSNKFLQDTIRRVGGGLRRKLALNDRIFGAYGICRKNGIPVNYICLAISAAANFQGDALSGRNLEDILKEAGSFNLIAGDAEGFALMEKYDRAIKSGASVRDLYVMVKSDDENI